MPQPAGQSHPELSTPSRVFSGTLFRTRQGRATTFTSERPAETELAYRLKGPSRAAFFLALAHHWEAEIEAGRFQDRAEIARAFGLTRARISQIVDLTLLAPEIQEAVIRDETSGGRELITERQLRQVVGEADWSRQREKWATLNPQR